MSAGSYPRPTLLEHPQARRPAPRVSAGDWELASFSTRSLLTYLAAGVLLSLGFASGLYWAAPVHGSGGSGGGAAQSAVHFINVSVVLDPANGFPRFVPANFSVPAGRVVFSITDRDAVVAWSGCPCQVTGTDGNVEWINGSSYSTVPSSNVAHTFTFPRLGISVFSPGASTVTFTVDLNQTGQFQWFCEAPCGGGIDAYTSPPMGVPGYMSGTLTVL